jgi:hypothetical protein
LCDALEGGQDEGSRLASAGLSTAKQVAAFEGDWYGLLLDRSGFYIAELLHGLEKACLQAEISERHETYVLLAVLPRDALRL